ncbi:MAG: ferrous iron transport protein B [Firmicutes bacterium]|nr:ferrous iron transport protein B [Bacillota bacterium]
MATWQVLEPCQEVGEMMSATMQTTPIIAIAGNPNSGKTALFNAMTGARQHVANWPGVTVEKKEGTLIKDGRSAQVVDLPGTYAFSSRAIDETIARDFILWEEPDVVINVVDATNLERNLYLTVQLLEMGAPLVLALNMMDEAEDLGLAIDVSKLSETLGIPVVPTAAVWGKGVDELIAAAFTRAGKPRAQDFRIDYGPVAEDGIARLARILTPEFCRGRSSRWVAIKLLEQDPAILKELESSANMTAVKSELDQALTAIRDAAGQEPADLITEKRYDLAASIAKSVGAEPELPRSSHAIDRIALHPWLAYPIFLAIIWAIFQVTFTVSEPLTEAAGSLIERLGSTIGNFLAGAGVPDLIIGLLVDGILGGVGAVLEFAPPIFMLFLMISLLEDVGYMARAALLSDRLMRAIGLHGKAFIPMILGFGCNVTGILATRTLDSRRDRLITILVNPLMSCAARLPVYVLFATAFFTSHRGLVVFSLYFLGVVLALIAAKVLSLFLEEGEAASFVLELPPYRLPRLSGVAIQTWERGKEFIHRAGTIILTAVVVVWALSNLPPGTGPDSPNSLVGRIGGLLAPILRPAGFGTWQAGAALIFGGIAKELIVGTLAVLYGTGEAGLIEAIRANWTPLSAYAFLVMSLVYIPCAATIAAIRTETGSRKWTAVTVAYTLLLGWTLAVIVYQGGRLLGFS